MGILDMAFPRHVITQSSCCIPSWHVLWTCWFPEGGWLTDHSRKRRMKDFVGDVSLSLLPLLNVASPLTCIDTGGFPELTQGRLWLASTGTWVEKVFRLSSPQLRDRRALEWEFYRVLALFSPSGRFYLWRPWENSNGNMNLQFPDHITQQTTSGEAKKKQICKLHPRIAIGT